MQKERLLTWEGETICLPDLPAEMKWRPCYSPSSVTANDINPYEGLKDALERIPQHKANKLDELLPQNWQKLKDNIYPE